MVARQDKQLKFCQWMLLTLCLTDTQSICLSTHLCNISLGRNKLPLQDLLSQKDPASTFRKPVINFFQSLSKGVLFFVIMYLFLQTIALLLLADLIFRKTHCMSALRLQQLQKLTLSLSLPVLFVVLPLHC